MDDVEFLGDLQDDGELVIAKGTTNGVEWIITIKRMIVNWRLHVTRAEDFGYTYAHGYCYFGTGPDTYRTALHAGIAWAGEGDPLHTDPPNFGKKAY